MSNWFVRISFYRLSSHILDRFGGRTFTSNNSSSDDSSGVTAWALHIRCTKEADSLIRLHPSRGPSVPFSRLEGGVGPLGDWEPPSVSPDFWGEHNLCPPSKFPDLVRMKEEEPNLVTWRQWLTIVQHIGECIVHFRLKAWSLVWWLLRSYLIISEMDPSWWHYHFKTPQIQDGHSKSIIPCNGGNINDKKTCNISILRLFSTKN